MNDMNDSYFLVVVVVIAQSEFTFVSEAMSRMWADICLREFILHEEPFKVIRAKLVKSTGEEA